MDRRIGGQWLRLLSVAVAAVALFFFIGWTLPLVYPFLLGWILAYTLNPLIGWLQRAVRLPRWLAVFATLALFAVSMLTVFSALVMKLVGEIMNFSRSLQSMVGWAEETSNRFLNRPDIQELVSRINSFYQDNPNYQETINGRISDTAQAAAEAGSNLIGLFLNGIVDVLSSLPQVATIAVVVLLASFFIGKDWDRYLEKLSGWFPEGARKRASSVWRDLRHALLGYVRAQLIMISITAVVVTIGLFVIGVNNALAVGLLIGFVDLLPYLGVGAAMVPWIAYAFIAGDWRLGTALSILYGVVLVARQIIEPKVLASSVGLDPLPTLVAMFVGLKLLGFPGLIVGPVAVVVLAACHRAGVFRDLGRYIVRGRWS